MELSKYDTKQLRQLQKDIDKELRSRRKQEVKVAQKELKEVAEKYGFSLNELVGAQTPTATTKRRPKYRHPEDPNKTWSGRGRKPVWIKDWEGQGRSLEDLRIG